jgi:uncharacterized membrane protein (Fun14 family)
MNVLWTYFWPAIGAGMICGIIAGAFGFRRRKARRWRALLLGGIAALALSALWHGPLGAADQLTLRAERAAREALDYYELPEVTAQLHGRPLSRRLLLTGSVDDFQTRELARVMSQVPGVSRATWSKRDGGVPLLAEAGAAALLGFLLGLLLAYLVELHRRYNAQWKW